MAHGDSHHRQEARLQPHIAALVFFFTNATWSKVTIHFHTDTANLSRASKLERTGRGATGAALRCKRCCVNVPLPLTCIGCRTIVSVNRFKAINMPKACLQQFRAVCAGAHVAEEMDGESKMLAAAVVGMLREYAPLAAPAAGTDAGAGAGVGAGAGGGAGAGAASDTTTGAASDKAAALAAELVIRPYFKRYYTVSARALASRYDTIEHLVSKCMPPPDFKGHDLSIPSRPNASTLVDAAVKTPFAFPRGDGSAPRNVLVEGLTVHGSPDGWWRDTETRRVEPVEVKTLSGRSLEQFNDKKDKGLEEYLQQLAVYQWIAGGSGESPTDGWLVMIFRGIDPEKDPAKDHAVDGSAFTYTADETPGLGQVVVMKQSAADAQTRFQSVLKMLRRSAVWSTVWDVCLAFERAKEERGLHAAGVAAAKEALSKQPSLWCRCGKVAHSGLQRCSHHWRRDGCSRGADCRRCHCNCSPHLPRCRRWAALSAKSSAAHQTAT